MKYAFVKCLLCNVVYIPRAGKELCLWEACNFLSCCDGKRSSHLLAGLSTAKVITHADSSVLSFRLSLETKLKKSITSSLLQLW